MESGDGYFRSRVPWAAAYLVISISPFLPGLFLPLCSAKCEKDESCTGCVTSFSAGRFVFDVAFTLVMTAHRRAPPVSRPIAAYRVVSGDHE